MANSGGMGRVVGLEAAFAAIVVAAPVALASPTPSPSLGSILVGPTGSEYTESDQGVNGPVSAGQWARYNTRVLDQLRLDNFVAGYTRTFTNTTDDKFLFEAVGAFGGAQDAKRYLIFSEASPTDDFYANALFLDSVNSFVGAHYADNAKSNYWDFGVFIKGNDFFDVIAESKKDDIGDLVSAQSKRLSDAAPRYTIPPSRWPENASSSSTSSFSFDGALVPIAMGAGGVLVLALLVVVVVILLSGRRRGSRAVEASPQMSPDGRYWWDGQGWRDAEQSAPPNATRSADGYYWWDGKGWRTAPSPAPIARPNLS
jgi:hypothetical protein